MGFIAKINSTDYTDRDITAGSSKVVVTDGDGISGNPSIDIDVNEININDLLPDQTGRTNWSLITNGTNALWSNRAYLTNTNGGTATLTPSAGTFNTLTDNKFMIQRAEFPGVGAVYKMYEIYKLMFTITSNGTANGHIEFTTSESPFLIDAIWTGFEITNGSPVYGIQSAGTNVVKIYGPGNTYPGFDGAKIVIQGMLTMNF